MTNHTHYRFVLRQTCTGTVENLLAARDIMVRGETLERLATNKPNPTADDIRFMWLSMLLEAHDINLLSSRFKRDDLVMFRSVLLAREPNEPVKVHELEPDYFDQPDIPF